MTSYHLKGMTWDHPRGYRCLEAASDCFALINDVAISWDRRSLQAFADASISALADSYDLIVLDHPHVGLIADSHCLLPLTLPDDVEPVSLGGSLESYVWHDRLWAYPVDAACQMAVKRPDLCHRELLNWEEALQVRPADFRMVTPLLPVDAFDMMMTLVAGLGEDDLPTSDERFTSDASGIKALKVLKALFKLGPSEAVSWNPIKVLEALSTTDDFACSPCLFGYINYARPGFRPHLLTYTDLACFEGLPHRRAILGGAGIGVSGRTAHPKEAIAFAQWVSSEPTQSGVYLRYDGQPAHRQTWLKMREDPKYSGFFAGAWRTMDHAWTRPRDIWFLGFVDDVCEIFPNFFLQDRDEEAFLGEINKLYRHHKTKGGVGFGSRGYHGRQ